MKKWKCVICGYVHEGEEPPESCPICKAPASKFVLLEGEEAQSAEHGRRMSAAPPKKKAPAPSSDRDRIRELEAEVAAARKAKAGEKIRLLRIMDALLDQMVKHHAHPVSVHFPNGVLPVAVIFFVIALILGSDSLALAGFFNIAAVLISLPLVIFAGFVEWRKKYNAAMTPYFKIKIGAAFVTLFTCLVSLVWYLKQPDVLYTCYAWPFMLVNLLMLGSAGVAGYLGGKLVFKD